MHEQHIKLMCSCLCAFNSFSRFSIYMRECIFLHINYHQVWLKVSCTVTWGASTAHKTTGNINLINLFTQHFIYLYCMHILAYFFAIFNAIKIIYFLKRKSNYGPDAYKQFLRLNQWIRSFYMVKVLSPNLFFILFLARITVCAQIKIAFNFILIWLYVFHWLKCDRSCL